MRNLNILLFFLIATNFILIGFLFSQFTGKAIYQLEKANLTRVIDGDTIDTNLGKIRLLGVNTPEKKERGYEEAANFLQQFQGKEISLERINEDKDKYGRLLRYVFYQGKLINEEILARGLAHFYSYQEDIYTIKLKNAEEKAQEKSLGIWEKSKNNCSKCITLVNLNPVDPGEYLILENNCYFSCNLNNWFIKDDASNKKILNFSLLPGKEIQLNYSGRVWNDAGDSLYLRDDSGLLVIFYRY
jgi:endonuclease YncB( thermonuclease family)